MYANFVGHPEVCRDIRNAAAVAVAAVDTYDADRSRENATALIESVNTLLAKAYTIPGFRISSVDLSQVPKDWLTRVKNNLETVRSHAEWLETAPAQPVVSKPMAERINIIKHNLEAIQGTFEGYKQ